MKNEDLLRTARERMSLAADADRENREMALSDLRMIAGLDHWDPQVEEQRKADSRPCLTINRLPQFVRQVTGDLRAMNPAVNVMAGDNQASEDVAEVYEGLIRHIQYRCDASSVYELAGIDAASCGMGYFRVLTDYADEMSFDQEVRIKRIPNPFSVYFDPDAAMPTREDAEWCFITEPMSKDAFEKAYPDKKIDPVETDSTDAMEHWRNADDVVVAEYFWREPVEVTISQLPDGRVVGGEVEGAQSRTATRHKVMWAKVSGAEVLEGPKEWPGKHIPVIAVMGEELHVGDRVFRSSVIRHAKDPQRLYNYWRSAQTELVALQPKAPFLVTADQIKGLEKFWAGANTENRPYLPFNVDRLAPSLMPQRQNPPVPSAGMMQEIGVADGDMKATTGIYDSSLGERSNEQSGVAIRQRQMESDVSTSVYSDHVGKAVEHCGRIIVDLIPTIYDTTRIVRILGKDDAQKLIAVNQPKQGPEGPMIHNDLMSGRYDVRVSVGPNYSTKRQETVQNLMEFVKAFPAAGAVTGDLIAKHMDWPGADQLAERLKKLLPPGVLDTEDMPPEQQQAMQQQAQMQQQVAQMQQQMQQMMAQLALQQEQAKAEKAGHDAERAAHQAAKARTEAQVAPVTARMGVERDALALRRDMIPQQVTPI